MSVRKIGDKFITAYRIPAAPFALPAESEVTLRAISGQATRKGRQHKQTPLRVQIETLDGRLLWVDADAIDYQTSNWTESR